MTDVEIIAGMLERANLAFTEITDGSGAVAELLCMETRAVFQFERGKLVGITIAGERAIPTGDE